MEKDISSYSPMMQNYLKTKQQYSDCILFYRLGDFYEMFFEDAINVSKELEITLTGRECGAEQKAPMCGVPYHSVNTYIDKLVKNGHKVAICEQLEDPKQAKGIVKRGVTRIITPGTATDSAILEEKLSSYIMSVVKIGIYYGVSVVDITTGEFKTVKIKEEFAFEKLLDEISRYNPKEILVNKALLGSKIQITKIKQKFSSFISLVDDKTYQDKFKIEFANKKLRLFNIYFNNQILDIENFFIDKTFELERASIYAMLGYLDETQKINLEHLNKIYIYENNKYMILDMNARKSLELTQRIKDGSKKGTLLWVIDKTTTSMGARLLNRWINDPLLDKTEINKRLDVVEEFVNNPMFLDDICSILDKIYDIERLGGKISYKNANAKELVALKNSIKNLPTLKEKLLEGNCSYLQYMQKRLDPLNDIYLLIENAIVDDPPVAVTEGEIIKKGYNEKLDELKEIANNSRKYLAQIEVEQREKTGIKNLKISYNKVFGYYFEVTKSFQKLVPNYFIRKQTLTNAERYVTPELKELEEKILNAKEQIEKIEYDIFCQIRDKILMNIKRIQLSSNIIATLDCLASFAKVSIEYEYCRPILCDEKIIEIKDGRHPVVEKMQGESSFIPNDTLMDDSNYFQIITRPNMAGKSTYMRQVALICLLSQIGCFVPATYAKIGIVDKIMTRVGASDDLSMGESTFMVEMMEVANILKNATPKSLLVLDEIGRGTSTYDGMAIAHSVAEYICQNIGARCFFATHYHELTQMDKLNGIKNYHIEVQENGDDVVFLRKIVEGGTDESFGIHVAKLAGIPEGVIKKAKVILNNLEKDNIKISDKNEKESKKSGQMSLFNLKLVEVAEELNNIDINEITPIAAFNILNKLKDMVQE